MSNRNSLYSLKKPTAWLWRTNFTRDHVLQRLQETKITGDWLVCPLGESSRAVTVEAFALNPEVFVRGVHSVSRSGQEQAADPDTESSSHPADPPATIPRRHDLDALRAIAMLLGIALHAAISFIPMPDAGWAVQDVRQSHVYGVFMAAIHGFRLPLFFLISGFFTAMLWRKRGLASLLKHRFKRIFLPLMIGLFTIVPAVWIVSIGAKIAASEVAADDRDRSSLWSAASDNDVPMINQLIGRGDDANQCDSAFGATPMSIAAQQGHVQAIDQLIAGGADVNARNRDGTTPLHAAAFYGRVEAAEMLLEQGADPNAKNRLGETAADTLQSDWARLIVAGAINGAEVDRDRIILGRQQVASLLPSQGQRSKPQPPTGAGGAETDKAAEEVKAFDLAGLRLFVTLFPLFHHLWFLWFLCWLVAAFVLYAVLTDLTKWKLPGWLVVSPLRYAWLIPLTMIPQSMMGLLYPNFGPDTSTGFIPAPVILFYYAVFFFFGAIYFDCEDSNGRLGCWWRITVPIALLIVFPMGYELSTGGLGFSNQWLDSGWCRPLAVLLQVVYVWLMSFGMMGLFHEVLARESPTMRYISDSSYWLYVAHLPLIIVVQAVVRTWQIPSFVKFTLICVVTSALLLASYQLFIRYTPIGTMLNGKRHRPQKTVASG